MKTLPSLRVPLMWAHERYQNNLIAGNLTHFTLLVGARCEIKKGKSNVTKPSLDTFWVPPCPIHTNLTVMKKFCETLEVFMTTQNEKKSLLFDVSMKNFDYSVYHFVFLKFLVWFFILSIHSHFRNGYSLSIKFNLMARSCFCKCFSASDRADELGIVW